MDDLEKYIKDRSSRDPEFKNVYEAEKAKLSLDRQAIQVDPHQDKEASDH